jgi:hypothetical protein
MDASKKLLIIVIVLLTLVALGTSNRRISTGAATATSGYQFKTVHGYCTFEDKAYPDPGITLECSNGWEMRASCEEGKIISYSASCGAKNIRNLAPVYNQYSSEWSNMPTIKKVSVACDEVTNRNIYLTCMK